MQTIGMISPIPKPIIDPPSPSSSGIGNTINAITKLDFTIDWPLLKIDYYSEKHSALRQWFEVIDFDLREQIKKEWIADMERLRVSIPFFLWFPTFTSKFGLPEDLLSVQSECPNHSFQSLAFCQRWFCLRHSSSCF